MLVFQGVRAMSKFTAEYPGVLLGMDEAGYMSCELFLAWCHKWEAATRRPDGRPRLLLFDSQFSHMAVDGAVFLRRHNVRVLTVHPHTTHLTCVLDNGPFKRSLRRRTRRRPRASARARGSRSFIVRAAPTCAPRSTRANYGCLAHCTSAAADAPSRRWRPLTHDPCTFRDRSKSRKRARAQLRVEKSSGGGKQCGARARSRTTGIRRETATGDEGKGGREGRAS